MRRRRSAARRVVRRRRPVRRRTTTWRCLAARLAIALLLAGWIGVTVWGLLFAPFLRIRTITVIAPDDVDRARVQAVVAATLAQRRFAGLVDGRRTIAVQPAVIAAAVRQMDPHVRTVTVTVRVPDALVVHVTTRPLTVAVCAAQQCHRLDDRGTLGPPLAPAALAAYPHAIVRCDGACDGAALPITPAMLRATIAAFRAVGWPLEEESFVLPHRAAPYLMARTRAGWTILWQWRDAPDVVVERLRAVLAAVPPAAIPLLARIDVRFDDYAYYRLHDGLSLDDAPPPSVE